jgi:thioredoxin-like negative regulator of GroEL
MKSVFYFTADWCNPCKKVKPIVEELNREQTMAMFQIIDADIEMELVKKFEIRSVPTFILMENGIELNRITGAQTRESLIGFING